MPLGVGVMGWSSAIVDIVGCDDRCPDKHCEERDDFCRGWERALDDPCVDEGKERCELLDGSGGGDFHGSEAIVEQGKAKGGATDALDDQEHPMPCGKLRVGLWSLDQQGCGKRDQSCRKQPASVEEIRIEGLQERLADDCAEGPEDCGDGGEAPAEPGFVMPLLDAWLVEQGANQVGDDDNDDA